MLSTFRWLGDRAQERGVCVALETGFPAEVEVFIRLVQEIDHPAVGATIDIGHVAWSVPTELRSTPAGAVLLNANIARVVRELRHKLCHFHIHNVRMHDWRDHRHIAQGVIDVPAVVRVLDEVGYAGMLSFEFEETETVGALAEGKAYLTSLIIGAPPVARR